MPCMLDDMMELSVTEEGGAPCDNLAPPKKDFAAPSLLVLPEQPRFSLQNLPFF